MLRCYTSDHFVLPLPPGHRFPMAKYRLLRERIEAELAGHAQLCIAEPATRDDLVRAHCPDYVDRVLGGRLSERELKRIGFPWSPAVAERTTRVSGATLAALESAIRGGTLAVNLAGGTHHAAYARGGGYCIFNDAVVAARAVQARGLARRVLVVDLDVHQGDGTAAICRDDPSIYTYSMHGARNYPAVKEPGDLDVALPDGTGDAVYLELLDRYLDQALAESNPDAVIYLAGADPYAGDALGYLSLSKAGLRERDRRVLTRCHAAGLPVAITMGGGYAPEVNDIVDIHAATVALAAEFAAAGSAGQFHRQLFE